MRPAIVLELHGAAKVPHRNREQLAKILGRPLSSIHLFEGHVGGGFGVRGELYPEDVLVCLAALRLGRPVKWIEDRHEHFVAANHSRQQRHKLRAAVDADGHILGIDDDFFHDQGAYVRTHGARVVDLTAGMLPGPYRVPAYRAAGHYRLTNKTPAATYRSPGRYESTFVRERLMDAIAEKLGIDRVEVRRRNLIDKSEMPFERPLTALGDEVVLRFRRLCRPARQGARPAIDWTDAASELAERRRNGEAGRRRARDVRREERARPHRWREDQRRCRPATSRSSPAALRSARDSRPSMAQICADTLGVDYRRIRVVHGQTNRIEHGIGAHATRATVMTGSATHVAALKVRALALETASQLLQTPADDADHRRRPRAAQGRAVGPVARPGEIARRLAPAPKFAQRQRSGTRGGRLVPHRAHDLSVRGSCRGRSIDRDTGGVTVERYLIAYDVGRAVNPMLIEGQLVGGFAQGLGGALSEEFVYDERGEPLATTFADYLVLTAREVPPVEVLLTEDAP